MWTALHGQYQLIPLLKTVHVEAICMVLCTATMKLSKSLNCYCMTYSEVLVLSYCFYTCHFTAYVKFWPITTRSVSDLNEVVCKDFNRTGLMCGECIAGHTPPVYSYSTACVECKDYKYNWLKYIAVAYLPLTLFCILIVFLRISAPMVVYVTVSQIISAPGVIRWYMHQLYWSKIIMVPFAIWNLDFFRSIYQPFCLHPDFSLLQVVCLDYNCRGVSFGVDIYLVRLHDRYVVISKLRKPVYRSCSLEWNIRESLIDVFATFIILSYVSS